MTRERRLAREKARKVCAVCGGPIFQRYEDGPWLHVNPDDWAGGNVHSARPVEDPGGDDDVGFPS